MPPKQRPSRPMTTTQTRRTRLRSAHLNHHGRGLQQDSQVRVFDRAVGALDSVGQAYGPTFWPSLARAHVTVANAGHLGGHGGER